MKYKIKYLTHTHTRVYVSCIFNKEEMSNSTCGEVTPELLYNRSICCQNLGSGLYPPEMEIPSILLYKTYVTLFDAILHMLIFKMLVTLCKFYYLLTKILLHCPNYDHLGFIIYLHCLSFKKCCN